MRFLLLDDNPADRELIARHLRQTFTDVELVEVGTPDQLARALDEGGFDLVLTDYLMGWTDGLTVLQQVQARMPDVPVIMVTGSGSTEVAVEGMKAGLSDYVLKRNLDRLALSVREALEKAELRRSQARLQRMWQAERERLLDEIERRVAELDAAFGALPNGLVLRGPRGEILRMNWEAARVLGYSPEEQALPLMERAAGMRFRWANQEPVTDLDELPTPRALRGETVKGTTLAWQPHPGEELSWFSVSAAPIRDEQGHILGAISTFTDITEHRRLLERIERQADELRGERELLQSIFDTVPVMFAIYDPAIQEVTLNQHVERVTGWTEEDTAHTNIMELAYPDPACRAEVAAYMQSLQPGFKDIQMRTKDGRILETRWANVQIPDGRQVGIGIDVTEQKQVEEERQRLLDKNLRQAAELEATIEAIADPVLFYLPDESVARLNHSAKRLLQGSPHERDRSILDRAQALQFQMPDGMPISQADLPVVRALRGERLTGFPVRFRVGPEGQWITALTSAAPVVIDGGKPLGAVVVLTDVTELMTVQQELEVTNVELEVALEEMKVQQKALLEAERKYRELVRHAPAGIYEIDFQGQHFISVNDAMCHLLGYSREELLAMNPFDMLDEEGRALFQSRIAKWLGGETPDPNVEFRVKTKDGRTIHALLNVTFTADENGRPLGATVVAHDITQRKRAEVERERLLAERTSVMESMVDGLTLADPEGRIIYHNPASLSLHGYSSLEEALLPKEQVVMQWELRGLDGEPVPVEEWPMPRALRGDIFSNYELLVRRVDTGNEFIGSYNGMLVRDVAGAPLFAMLTVRDITERKRAEEALARRTQELELLNRTTQALAGTAELDHILESVLQELRASLGTAAASAWLIDPKSGELVCRRAVGPECKVLEDHRLAPVEGLTAWVARHGQSVVVPNVADDPRHVRAIDQPGETVMQSFLAVPMFVKGKRIGVLRVVGSRADQFDEGQRALAESIAAVAAVAIERAQLYEQAREEAEVRAALLREINHRVKNNLSSIVGLLYAERRRSGIASSPECNCVIDDLIHRVRGLAAVHTMLSARGWRPLRLRDLVVEVITSAIEALKDGRTFSLEVSPSPVRVTAAQAHHLALLLNELGTNTLKHGSAQNSIHVWVEIDVQDGQIRLRYRDDGPGFPREVLEGEAYSVGLDLARSMVERGLRGDLELSNDAGAVAMVRFDVDVG